MYDHTCMKFWKIVGTENVSVIARGLAGMEKLLITKEEDKGICGVMELLSEKMWWWLTKHCPYLLKLQEL